MASSDSMCSLGISRTWVGAWGLMSRKAITRSDSRRISAGTSRAAILQNRQLGSLIGSEPTPRSELWAAELRGGRAVARLTAELRQSREELALLARQLPRRHHVQRHEEVAPPPSVEVGDALALETDDRAGFGPRVDADGLGPIDPLDPDVSAQRGAGHRDVEDREQVLPASLEPLRRFDLELDEQVARGPAGHAGVPAPGHAELHPVGHAGWDLDRDRRRLPDTPLARARLARVGDLLAGPAAGRARRRRHQRSEDAPPHALDLTGPAARPAGDRRRSRFCPVAQAPVADDEPLDLDVLANPERGLAERETEPDADILAPPRARARPS